MKKENKNNFTEQIESFRLEEDLNELEESYMKIHRFKKGQSYKKKDKQSFNTKMNLFKTYKRVSNMKAPTEMTGNITSEITSGITSPTKSHSLTGMAEHLSEAGRNFTVTNYKLQITNNFKKLKKT